MSTEDMLDKVYDDLEKKSVETLFTTFCVLKTIDPDVMDNNSHYTVKDLLQEEIITYLKSHPEDEEKVRELTES